MTDSKVDEQNILKIFDKEPDPSLTTAQIVEHFPTTEQNVRLTLKRMEEDGLLESKSPAKGELWTALVAPELDDDAAERVDDAKKSDFVFLDN